MTDNEFILFDRCEKIKSVIKKYGEENFYIAFSGGKDSTVLSELIDSTLPNNTIARVYADTGIELTMIRDFVYNKAKNDGRFIVIKPQHNIKDTLETYGYPFKSKIHAHVVDLYQNYKFEKKMVLGYLGKRPETWHSRTCPKCLEYQFKENTELAIKISDMCCVKMKEEPMEQWSKLNNKEYAIIGTMQADGGRRSRVQCLAFQGKKLKSFQPLAPVSKEWEEWFIDKYGIDICDIYKPPYNFVRTGCKGCPFARNLQDELDILEKYFPNERRQCEYIWKPIYDEYRRIGYRLKD